MRERGEGKDGGIGMLGGGRGPNREICRGEEGIISTVN